MVDVFSFPSRTTLTEDVIQHIISAIRDGNLRSGEKLPSERELSQELDVSRSCVREAFQALAMLRLIDIKSGRGAYIRNIQPEEVIDANVLSELIQGDSLVALVETRRILEVEIARLAAERRSEEQLQEIAKIFIALDNRHLTVSQILEFDIEFHTLLSQATNNPVLFKLYQSILPLLADSRKKVNLIPGARDKSWVYHRAIYEAVRRQDGAEAKKVMMEHLEDVWADINKYLLGGREPNHESYQDKPPHDSGAV